MALVGRARESTPRKRCKASCVGSTAWNGSRIDRLLLSRAKKF